MTLNMSHVAFRTGITFAKYELLNSWTRSTYPFLS